MDNEVPLVKQTYRKAYNPGLGGLFYAMCGLLLAIGISLVLAFFVFR
jgi:hypothetical protein